MEHLYERIRYARECAGLSVNEAAEKLGVSRVQIWRMENKAETISAERLFILAAIYEVDPYTLFHGVQAATTSRAQLYERIGEVVALVEAEAQKLDVKPPPHLVGEAVVEVLKQETKGETSPDTEPLDVTKYQGLLALLFKQASSE